ncbi:MAG: phosphoribosylaminoimidazolesuccinocarboxamide synthase [Defluviitaleaceae bacterium]|nr:phosphoribosylaminoimidazolesuccinocarboxamide synthase [Defluviitaleaceae bacterium]
MKLLYTGKTKNVFDNEDSSGNYTLKLKDTATGKDGVFDPGENTVGLTIDGLGIESLKLSSYFFELLKKEGIATHYVSSNIDEAEMIVKPATIFGKGLEFVCRFKADGSFIRRYGDYISFGEDLSGLVEVTLKSDEKGDPPATRDTLEALKILTADEFIHCKYLTRKIAKIINEALKEKSISLADIKFEFGKDKDGTIMLIDEISGGCMRAYKDGAIISPLELTKLVL